MDRVSSTCHKRFIWFPSSWFSCYVLQNNGREKNDFPLKIQENPGKMRIWGLRGAWGGRVTVNLKQRVAQKPLRNILLHFGIDLVTFRIHFRKAHKVIIVMFSDLVDVSMSPQTNYLQVCEHKVTSNNS